MSESETRAAIKEQLSQHYVLIAKRDFLPYSIAAIAVLGILGVSSWQVAKTTALKVANSVANSTAASQTTAEINTLYARAQEDSAALHTARQQWEKSDPTVAMESRLIGLTIGLENLYSHTQNHDKMAYIHWVDPAYKYYYNHYDMSSPGPEDYPADLSSRTK